jgi:hypothetical protein
MKAAKNPPTLPLQMNDIIIPMWQGLQPVMASMFDAEILAD